MPPPARVRGLEAMYRVFRNCCRGRSGSYGVAAGNHDVEVCLANVPFEIDVAGRFGQETPAIAMQALSEFITVFQRVASLCSNCSC